MQPAQEILPQPLSPGLRRMMQVVAALFFLGGAALFLLPGQTDRYFSWTIAPPLTAAVLGSWYWTCTLFFLLSARETVWVRVRCTIPPTVIVTVVTLLAILLHLDRFHFGRELIPTAAFTWGWFLPYLACLPIVTFLLIRQLRLPGGDPVRTLPLPTWFRVVLGVEAVVLLAIGLIMLGAPSVAAAFWPWALTALTSQAMSAFVLGHCAVAVQLLWENDRGRGRAAFSSRVALAALQAIAILRYSSQVDWARSAAWLYVAFLFAVLAIGVYALWGGREPVAA